MKRLATPALEMPRSAIRVILDLASSIPDVIHLEIGQPDFPTPVHISEAGCEAARRGYTGYTLGAGLLSLREAVVEKLRRENGIEASTDNVVITAGAMGGLYTTLRALAERGDHLLLPDPGYPNYEMMASLGELEYAFYPLDPASGFLPDLDILESLVTDRTKAIIVNSPSNPTGTVIPQAVIQQLLDFAERHDLYLVSDESYERIVFDARHISPAALAQSGRVVSIFSFSKTYSMTGWRVGYVVAAKEVAQLVAKLQEPIVACAPSISQKAAEAALRGPQDCVGEMVATYRRRRDAAVGILHKYGLYEYVPQGAFYLLVRAGRGIDSYEFAKSLLRETRVAVAPGRTFGPSASDYVRASLCASDANVCDGLERLCKYLDGA